MGTSGVVLYLDCSSSYIIICIFVKKYETLHLKWVKCVLYKLYLKNKLLKESDGKSVSMWPLKGFSFLFNCAYKE